MAGETSATVPGYELSDRRDIHIPDIQTLRESVGWLPDEKDTWKRTLEDALHVSSAYENDKLVGIGFLVGTLRHAVLCDICVDPGSQSQGLGRLIVDSLVEAANVQGVRYVTLTYAEDSPWLEDMYSKSGFRPISNAMQLVRPEGS